MVPAAFGLFEGSQEQVSGLFRFRQTEAGAISAALYASVPRFIAIRAIQPPFLPACPRR